MQRYNLLYIISGSVEDDKVPETASAISAIITKNGAKIIKDEALGKRRLAYPIEHIRMGHYQDVDFDLEQADLLALDTALRLDKTVLRHQIVKVQVRTPEQLAAAAKLREKIAAQREAVEEAGVVSRLQEAETKRQADKAPTEAPKEVSKEELDKKLEEFLGGDVTPTV
jgi:small subunit ribosomal protein S6